MKEIKNSLPWMLAALFALALSVPTYAQDDLYYDPATDAKTRTTTTTTTTTTYDEYEEPSKVTRRYENEDYYEEDDEYAYEYSSRVRRFHRPARVVDYYDPFFVDLYNYDPYFLPGNSIYTYGYNDYWSWRRWRRYQRWNAYNSWNAWNSYNYGWGAGWNSFGWNSCYVGHNPWNNPWAFNNYYYDPYWTFNGYNPYYGGGWGNNYYSGNNGGNNGGGGGYTPKTYTGVRRHGTSVNPGYARLAGGNGRLATAETNVPTLEAQQTRPNGRAVGTKNDPNGVSDRNTTGRQPAGTTNGNGREAVRANETNTRTGREAETAPSRRPDETRPARNTETTPSRRPEETRPTREVETTPSRRPAETRPSRPAETAPARREESRPARPSSEESRPARREESRPSRPSGGGNDSPRPSRTEPSNDRPSRSGGGEMRTAPSRSESSGGSSRSGGGNSGGSSKPSGGGRGGRN